jgi:phage terminase large subunit GpA-like protein
MARNMAAAEREYAVSGDPKTLKEVTVKQVGYLFSTKGTVGTIEASTLAERAKNELQPLGVVPEGVRFLFCWFDVQVAHFEVLVRGFGVDAESWVIDKRRVPAETATDGKAWLALLQELITKRYPLATDPTRGMVCRAVGYDAQGAPGSTNRANEAWKALRAEGKALRYGVIAGRDVWSVVPTQGAPSDTAARLVVVYPDNQRKDRNTSASGAVPWARFNPNLFKDDLFGQLQKMLPGPDYVHIPAALRSESAPHVNFEQLVSEQRNQTTGRWKKPHQAIRNEMLDLMVGTHVLAHLHGLARINWSAPPPWAQAWDKNTTIVPMVDVQQTATPAGQPSGAPPRRTIGSLMKGDE